MRDILKEFMLECINAVGNCGFRVTTLSSDLDRRNTSLWNSLGIYVSTNGEVNNSFVHNGHEIYTQPDPCHIIKNLRSAMLRQVLYLCPNYVEHNDLPTNEVRGSYVEKLWQHEISCESEERLLHHLERKYLYPNTFQAMNVGGALQFFSPITASALKTAVQNKILPKEALTTAHFIGLMHEYFSLMLSQLRKTSFILRNFDRKYIF